MGNNTTVLVVDDSRMSRMMIRAIVLDKHPDWSVVEAGDGDEALEKCKQENDIALMILDFNMPGMDGLALAKELKDGYPKSHISLLTANVQNSTREKAAELGVYFAPKPITEERIVDIIDSMVA